MYDNLMGMSVSGPFCHGHYTGSDGLHLQAGPLLRRMSGTVAVRLSPVSTQMVGVMEDHLIQ